MSDWLARLQGGPGVTATFDESEIAGLDEPVRRYLSTAIAPNTPLHSCVQIKMRGTIKLRRWLPFRARQILAPTTGFIWRARVAGLISGYDQYFEESGAMRWRLGGLLPLAQMSGPDVSRSAAGRGAAESVWAPTTLLPRFGVRWAAVDETTITARRALGPTETSLTLRLDGTGQIASFIFDRWGDPDSSGAWGLHPFGGEVTAHRVFDGMSIPSAGRLGWNFGTGGWAAGEFFRFEIRDLAGA
ncbi:DUF6544 family protein [Tomitella biformata]|uniref:DUF6544 family protein n=1 Tax=Tomitella biformata TaxID=630403 RepID=UPI000465551D|nr:DUF6544 family protein [Tomitella biformata]